MKNKETETVVVIDGLSYQLEFAGFDTPMNAHLADYPRVSFQPWRLGEHLHCLSLSLIVTPDGLSLNQQAFSAHVLLLNHIPADLHRVYAPLALWWASGGGEKPVLLAANTYQLGNIQAQLKPWGFAQRLAALQQCQQTTETGVQFDLAAYLSAMLHSSVINLNPPQALDLLDSAAGSALLAAVIALNIHTVAPSFEALLQSPHTAAMTLKICQTLGWTPSQVLAAPAVEMDLILALLNRANTDNAPAPKAQSGKGLAAHHDAVIIQIEDD